MCCCFHCFPSILLLYDSVGFLDEKKNFFPFAIPFSSQLTAILPSGSYFFLSSALIRFTVVHRTESALWNLSLFPSHPYDFSLSPSLYLWVCVFYTSSTGNKYTCPNNITRHAILNKYSFIQYLYLQLLFLQLTPPFSPTSTHSSCIFHFLFPLKSTFIIESHALLHNA